MAKRIFPSLSPEDEKRLLDMLPEQARPNLQKEETCCMRQHMRTRWNACGI